uniref:Orc1-like AAA ATPase domain-containing protein n=1 Tax=Odontella aurita TaxID=265563 RepID=A0A7S4N4G3_9STRA
MLPEAEAGIQGAPEGCTRARPLPTIVTLARTQNNHLRRDLESERKENCEDVAHSTSSSHEDLSYVDDYPSPLVSFRAGAGEAGGGGRAVGVAPPASASDEWYSARKTKEVGTGGDAARRSGSLVRLLACPGDSAILSETVCIARAQIEVFAATAEDVKNRLHNCGVRDSIEEGRVGIRCVHCARERAAAAASGGKTVKLSRGAISYPKTMRLVNQAVRNWQRNHLMQCPFMPEGVKKRCLELKQGTKQQQSAKASASYWHDCLTQIGVIDTGRGVRLRNSVFEDSDEADHGPSNCEPLVNGSNHHALHDLNASVNTAAGHAARSDAADLTVMVVRQSPACVDIPKGFAIGQKSKSPAGNIDKSSVGTCEAQTAHSSTIRSEVFDLDPAAFDQSSSASTLIPERIGLTERVKMARDVVQVMTEIQPVWNSIDGGDAVEHRQKELHSLGVELYELFTGNRPFDDADDGRKSCSAEDATLLSLLGPSGPLSEHLGDNPLETNSSLPSKQNFKRKKQRDTDRNKKYVPLSELGFPVSLCTLVSNLLDATDANLDDVCAYGSVIEVHEDLGLMAYQPNRFLFDHNSAQAGEMQQLIFLPDSLYGRKHEVAKLLDAYQQMIFRAGTSPGANNVILLSGYSGTGKSSLVRNVQKQFVEMGACFVSGKFDSMCQMKPLSAVMSALNEYCHILAKNVARIDRVREAVLVALGEEVHVLAALIPKLAEILPEVGEQPSTSNSIWMPEAQHRIAFLIRLLLRSTCTKETPMVLFLDDLQWADSSSLELMRSLVTDPMLDSLLCIGSYRDNDVWEGHPLLECLRSIQRSGRTYTTQVCTSNLHLADINGLVSDALHMLPRTTRSLSETVLQKTGGNALFVKQFLTSLYDEGLLRYSLLSRRWEWDINTIRSKSIENNVVELMKGKLLRLAPEVHSALRIAAAFGSQCQEEILQVIDSDPCHLMSTAASLEVAVAEGLMAKVDGPAYRFSHDQIQNAAYMLIPETERGAHHLGIGRSLWRQSTEEEIEKYLFSIVDQCNRGAYHIADHDEKINLAQLSFIAGQKAAAMSAFLSASTYLKAGIKLMQETDWDQHRDLCFGLHNLEAEMEYILGNVDEVKVQVDNVIRRGRTLQEKLRAYYTFVQSSGSHSNTRDAFDTGITVLGFLGESIPPEVTQLELRQELTKTQILLSKNSENDLQKMKTMSDSNKMEAMRFFGLVLFYAYSVRQEYFPLIACRMVQLSLSYGVCRESAIAFAAHGMSVCGLVGDAGCGYRLGKIALLILNRFNASECLPRVFLGIYGFINDWTDPLQSSLPCLKQAVEVGLSKGDTEYAMINAQYYQGTSLASGKPLGALFSEMNGYANQMLELNQHLIYTLNRPLRQFALNLLGKSADPVKLVGEVMDEGAMLDLAEEKGSATLSSVVYLYRMWLEFLFGQYEHAAETAEKNKDVEKNNMGRFGNVCNHFFYYGLTAIVLARKQGRSAWEGAINTTMGKMSKWAKSAPWNCDHKLELMIAEYSYLENNLMAAAKAYDSAIASANKHRFVHEEALALERAGIFYLETGNHSTASGYFARAHACYLQWEAHSKAAHVERYM